MSPLDFLKGLPPAYLVTVVYLILLFTYISTKDPQVGTMLNAMFYALLAVVGVGGIKPPQVTGSSSETTTMVTTSEEIRTPKKVKEVK